MMLNFDVRQWFEGLHFAEPSFFQFFYLAALMFAAVAALVFFKFFLRPRKSKYSRYELLGPDFFWLPVLFLIVLMILALAGPRINSGYSLGNTGGVDILVLLDESISMLAKDLKPSRQEAAKKISLGLIEKGILRPGDRVAFFAFGGITRWRMPLSEDFNDFKVKISEIGHPPIYQEESQLDTDFAYLLAYVAKSIDKQDNFIKNNLWNLNFKAYQNNRMAFLLSDGNNESDSSLDAGFSELTKRNIKIYAIGLGTKKGETVTVKAYNIENSDKPPEKITIKTVLQMKELEKAAESTGGKSFVFDAESKQAQLDSFIRQAVSDNRSLLPKLIFSDREKDIWWDVLAVPTVILLILVICLG